LALTGVAVVIGADAILQTVIGSDPYAPLKKVSKSVDPSLGMSMNNVHIESFDHGKRTVTAEANRLDINQDKEHYDLFGVHNGTFFGKNGTVGFDADQAKWDVQKHEMNAPFGGHVKDKNVDLKVDPFAFDSKTGVVTIPKGVIGKFYDGQIKAQGVQYDINRSFAKAGHADWIGKPGIDFQQAGAQGGDRVWQVNGDDVESDGDIMTAHHGGAYDGNIWVFADLIVRDRAKEVVTATGHVRYYSSKVDMTCEKAVVDRTAKIATMTGDVQMLFKAKEDQGQLDTTVVIPPYKPVVPDDIAQNRPPAPGERETEEQKRVDKEIRSTNNVRDYPTMCHADKVVYCYEKGKRHADISGDPQARQEFPDGNWRQVWTNTGYYDGEKETLTMTSSQGKRDTRLIDSDGDDSVMDSATVSTKENDEHFRGHNVSATVPDRSDEIPAGDKTTKPPKTSKTDLGTGTGGTGTGTGTGTGGGKG